MFPWICAHCGREFDGKKLNQLTVHHKDHNHDNNPPDGTTGNCCVLVTTMSTSGTGGSSGSRRRPGARSTFDLHALCPSRGLVKQNLAFIWFVCGDSARPAGRARQWKTHSSHSLFSLFRHVSRFSLLP
jgi:hypothetical protein